MGCPTASGQPWDPCIWADILGRIKAAYEKEESVGKAAKRGFLSGPRASGPNWGFNPQGSACGCEIPYREEGARRFVRRVRDI